MTGKVAVVTGPTGCGVGRAVALIVRMGNIIGKRADERPKIGEGFAVEAHKTGKASLRI
ncbi:MAG: hypothetical protein A4E65_02719 [Syntrophorhabdus sp. PtaU1.Bin153]|nr:MAG: hypothetical protein A4E65_02719 [Syntrophorhabdus sp. PtaU1.Bin153]